MSAVGGADADEWRGIHVTRGMRLRLSNVSFVLGADGSVQGSPVEVSLSVDMYVYWLEIAFGHLLIAEEAHAELLAVWDTNDPDLTGPPLEREFSSSMQCLTAAVVAIDAFYAVARDHIPVAPDEVEAWRRNRTSRPRVIAEVLRRGFLMGPKTFAKVRSSLVQAFEWRDWAVHPPAGYNKPVRYDELHVGTEWRFVAYRCANAKAVLGLALSLVAQLLERPRPEHAALAEHCQGMVAVMAPLVEKWEGRYGQLYDRQASDDGKTPQSDSVPGPV